MTPQQSFPTLVLSARCVAPTCLPLNNPLRPRPGKTLTASHRQKKKDLQDDLHHKTARITIFPEKSSQNRVFPSAPNCSHLPPSATLSAHLPPPSHRSSQRTRPCQTILKKCHSSPLSPYHLYSNVIECQPPTMPNNLRREASIVGEFLFSSQALQPLKPAKAGLVILLPRF